MYEYGLVDGAQYKVDVDKIIEETKQGLFTGIGVGGKEDGGAGSCYARKCEVERQIIDEDSEDEGEEEDDDDDDDDDDYGDGDEDEARGRDGLVRSRGDRDGDVDMA